MQFEKDLTSIHKALFLQLREILLKDSEVSEIKKQRMTTYHFAGSGLCHIRTMPKGVDIGFLKGAQLEDKFGMLKGSGKKVKVLHLTKEAANKFQAPLAYRIVCD